MRGAAIIIERGKKALAVQTKPATIPLAIDNTRGTISHP
jgi:hypothetical protein